eukprot:scaffold15032_cov119-Cylindrotheca_fusiformis.AAC.3
MAVVSENSDKPATAALPKELGAEEPNLLLKSIRLQDLITLNAQGFKLTSRGSTNEFTAHKNSSRRGAVFVAASESVILIDTGRIAETSEIPAIDIPTASILGAIIGTIETSSCTAAATTSIKAAGKGGSALSVRQSGYDHEG